MRGTITIFHRHFRTWLLVFATALALSATGYVSRTSLEEPSI